MVGPVRPQFVLFGSSIVEFSFGHGGWGAILSEIYSRKADIFLRGYGGWNSRRGLEVLEQVFPKDDVVQPSLVIVYFGGNDSVGPHESGLGQHVPLPEYVNNMKKIATYLLKLSDKTRVIFLTAPPINKEQIDRSFSGLFAASLRSNELCHQYSDACISLCKELNESNLKVIDLWNALQQRPDWSTVYFRDGIHFTAEASKVVVAEISKVLKEADWEPSLHWKSMPVEFSGDSPYYPVAHNGKETRWDTFYSSREQGSGGGDFESVEGSRDWEPSLHWKSMPVEFSGDSPYYPVAHNGKETVNISRGTFHWETQWE